MARHHQIGISALIWVAAVVISATAHPLYAAQKPLAPTQILQVQPPLTDDKEAENISGAACAFVSDKGASCLLIGDEKRYARFFTLKGDTLVPGKQLFLLPKEYTDGQETKEYTETDAEGIAFSHGTYFLTGSHGLNKSGDLQPSRYFIYRVSVDQDTGLTADFGSKEKPSVQVKRSANLQAIIHNDPELSKHEVDIPDLDGINVEGLAVSGDTLYFGFRGPLLSGEAVVASLSLSDAFDNPTAELKTHSVELGNGQGVRDIAAAGDGFLILWGPEKDTAGPAGICFWKPGSDAKACREITKAGPADSKPEALTVLETTADHYKVLIMSDGVNNGAPAVYEVPR
ncbi:DUF3616 domain-containing protein [Rhizobium ruizarguesonis]|uniref:DUF3616 domain-containing protein n=1 Tax=Rhizobium ruizarguesonis TaxID=2081791 RepID=UPI00103036D2|nr:DUF3616 domain-containing protein [Rhizobium ruizarguesonis]TAT71058.1 DUF3616 domain-containing protein [Rhizobium ruizarguesonis]